MRIAVTGGAGFVGVHLVTELLLRGHQVHVYDNLFAGRRTQDLPWLDRVSFVRGDLLEAERLQSEFRRFAPDIVFHLAAIHYLPYCDQHPSECMRVNVEGTLNLMRAAAACHARGVGFASSVAVYPPTDAVHSEKGPVGPCDIYGLSKQLGESIVDHYARAAGMAHLCFRFSNIYGPLETNPHVIPTVLDQLLNGANEIRLGRTDTFRDFIYVEDTAELLADALPLLSAGTTHDVVNLASGSEASIGEVVDLLCASEDRQVRIARDEARVRPADRKHLRADTTHQQEIIPRKTRFDLRSGLAATLAFERRHRRALGMGVGARD